MWSSKWGEWVNFRRFFSPSGRKEKVKYPLHSVHYNNQRTKVRLLLFPCPPQLEWKCFSLINFGVTTLTSIPFPLLLKWTKRRREMSVFNCLKEWNCNFRSKTHSNENHLPILLSLSLSLQSLFMTTKGTMVTWDTLSKKEIFFLFTRKKEGDTENYEIQFFPQQFVTFENFLFFENWIRVENIAFKVGTILSW